MRKFLLFISSSFLLYNVSAQESNSYSLEGTVSETAGEIIPYATVALLLARDTSAVSGVITDENGHFIFEKLPEEKYMVRVNHLAYKGQLIQVELFQNTILDTIFLQPSSVFVKTVTVKGKFIERRSDRFVVSMAGNPIAENRTIAGTLSMLPGVTNLDGFRINGQPNPTFYINGRKLNDRRELSAIQAKYVDKIEVIPMAGASYDAQSTGGVINIFLNKIPEGGYVGSVSLGGRTSDRGTFGYNLSSPVSYRNKRLSFYNYIYGGKFEGAGENEITREYSERNVVEKRKTLFSNMSFSDNMSLVHDFNQNHSVGANLRVGLTEGKPEETNSSSVYAAGGNSPYQRSRYRSFGTTHNNQYQAALNYIWLIDDKGSRFTLVGDYLRHIDKSDLVYGTTTFNLVNDTRNETQRRNYFDNTADSFEGDAKFEFRLGKKSVLGTGARYYYNHTDRKLLYEDRLADAWAADLKNSDHFIYEGQGAATYLEYSNMIGDFSFNAGIRGQFDQISYESKGLNVRATRNYWNFFPVVGFGYVVNEEKDHFFNINYRHGMQNVPNQFISPAVVEESEYLTRRGNPNLHPSRNYSVQTSFFLHGKWQFTYTFRHTKDMIYQKTFTDPSDSLKMYIMPVNIGKEDTHMLFFGAPLKVTKWWNLNWVLRVVYDNFSSPAGDLEDVYGTLSLSNSFRFPKGWGGTMQVNGETSRKTLNGQMIGLYRVNASVYRSMLKNKLRVSVNCYNLLHRNRTMDTFRNINYYERNRRTGSDRFYNLAVTFNFKGGNYSQASSIKRSKSIQSVQEVTKDE